MALKRRLWRLDTIEDDYTSIEGYVPATKENANLVGSGTGETEVGTGEEYHLPVFDIDFPAKLLPSSTPGHFHLYLDRPMPWRKYRRLMKAMERAGVVQKGWVSASIRRGQGMVRAPWVKKGSPDPDPGLPIIDVQGNVVLPVEFKEDSDPEPDSPDEGLMKAHITVTSESVRFTAIGDYNTGNHEGNAILKGTTA